MGPHSHRGDFRVEIVSPEKRDHGRSRTIFGLNERLREHARRRPSKPRSVASSLSPKLAADQNGLDKTMQPQTFRASLPGYKRPASFQISEGEPLAEDDAVWVRDKGAFVQNSGRWSRATVVRASEGDHACVRFSALEGDRWVESDFGEVEVERRLIQLSNANRQDDCFDIAELSSLNEPAVMEHIRMRYVRASALHAAGELPGGIYTRAGVVVVAMNPFTPVERLYADDQLALYRDAAGSGGEEAMRRLPPHIFEVAARAYARMQQHEPQSICINGESGAGKTESTKSECAREPSASCTRTHAATWSRPRAQLSHACAPGHPMRVPHTRAHTSISMWSRQRLMHTHAHTHPLRRMESAATRGLCTHAYA